MARILESLEVYQGERKVRLIAPAWMMMMENSWILFQRLTLHADSCFYARKDCYESRLSV